jgi:tol-pal system protein YbgF
MTWARRAAWVVAMGALLVPAAGCMTRADGDRLAREATDRERRLRALEEGMEQERAELRQEVERAKEKVAALGQVLEEATRVVTRNSADLGHEVEQLQGQMGQLEGALAEARHELDRVRGALVEQRAALEEKIDNFARRAGIDMPLPASQIPSDPAAHLKAAREALSAGDHSRARALLREYLVRYPKDERSGQAQHLLGQSYMQQGRPATALAEYRKVLSNYRDSDAAADALFGMGEAFFALHSCTDAKNAFEALIRAHPKSSLVKPARDQLREIQRAPRSQCTN